MAAAVRSSPRSVRRGSFGTRVDPSAVKIRQSGATLPIYGSGKNGIRWTELCAGFAAFDHYCRRKRHPASRPRQSPGQSRKDIFVQLPLRFPAEPYQVAGRPSTERSWSRPLFYQRRLRTAAERVYIKDEQDVGKFINDNIANIPGIVRSLTTLTFRAFCEVGLGFTGFRPASRPCRKARRLTLLHETAWQLSSAIKLFLTGKMVWFER